MSGLFSAAFLRQIGWQVDVYERSPVELVGRGAGITTHPELLEALGKSGAGTRDLGVEVEKRITLDRHGRVIAEKHQPQILTSWDRLQRLMRATIDEARYHLGHTFERVEQDGSGVLVHFTAASVNAPISSSAGTASGRAYASRLRPRCSRSIRAITSGAARRRKPISRRRRARAFSLTSLSSCPSGSRSSVIRSLGSTTICASAIAATISSGIGSVMRRSCGGCALTSVGTSTTIRCRRPSSART